MEDVIMEYVIYFIIAFAVGFVYSYEPQTTKPIKSPSFKLTAADCKAKI